MIYTVKAHPTLYKGTLFRSRLEARWAVFADIVEWDWEYEPIDLHGWTPDFKFTLPCEFSKYQHHGCWHSLYAEVKPYSTLEEFQGHALTRFDPLLVPAPAMFGLNPDVTHWEMSHGADGGVRNALKWSKVNVDRAWEAAGNVTRYRPEGKS